MEFSKSYKACLSVIALSFCMVTMIHTNMKAGPGYYGSGGTSLGIRLGWSGAPNGITLRHNAGSGHAFEFVLGYNAKVGRTTESLTPLQKGNSFLGASYAPYFLMVEGNLGVALTADLGARLRYHHYRPIAAEGAGMKITPDLLAGLGIQLEFSESVELFADLHVNYYNRYDNIYVPGVESGLGLRIMLN